MAEEKYPELENELYPEAPPGNEAPQEISTDELLRQVRELTRDMDVTARESPPSRTEAAPRQETQPAPPAPAPQKKKLGWISEFLFYAVLAFVVVGAFFIRSNADGSPALIGGYSAFIVKTGSMQAEIPKDSIVVTRQVDPKTLQIGDDITFMANRTTTITHRIIEITENFNGTGQRSFKTQGIMNKEPDKNPVSEVNIVGKVVFHSEIIGLMAIFISKNWPIIIFAAAVIAVLYAVLKKLNAPAA